MYRIKISGNFLVILNETDQSEHARHPLKDCDYELFDDLTANPLYRLTGIFKSFGTKGIPKTEFRFDELLDDSGVNFTSTSVLNTLLEENLGKSSGGEATSITTQLNELGSIQFTDTQYTSVSPLTVLSDIDTQLPNNKGNILNISAPTAATTWCESDGKLNNDNGNGDSFLTRITFKVLPQLNNRNLSINLNIGGSQGIIWEVTERLSRGANTESKISLVIPYYILNTFYSNGGSLIINCDGNIDVYDIVYLIQKTKNKIV